jgi:hypothetical protein
MPMLRALISNRHLCRLLLLSSLLWVTPMASADVAPICGDPECQQDPGYCGDGICGGGETCSDCPWDCGECQGYCGDGICAGGETCSDCSGDCGECPANPGDGHATCDGWDRQGACALSFPSVAGSVELRRFRGGRDGSETYLSAGYNGSGFSYSDGTVGIVSTSPLPGQVPLHHWSSRRGYVYDLNPYLSARDYVYRGIAGYVWPPGTNQGFPLYRTFSSEYGFFYTNFPTELTCERNVRWQPFGEIARVNWPAPFVQAVRRCFSLPVPPIPNCDPFVAERCRQAGGVFFPGNCSCLLL